MSNTFDWEDTSAMYKSVAASALAGLLYLIVTILMRIPSSHEIIAIALIAVIIMGLGFLFSGLSQKPDLAWAITSGVVTGMIIALQSGMVLAAEETSVSQTLLTLANIPIMVGIFLVSLGAIYVYENQKNLI